MEHSFETSVIGQLKGFARLPSSIGDFPWKENLQREEYQQALDLVDEKLTEEPASVHAKLAWIYSQVGLGNVPITALSSPFEEIYPLLKNEPELSSFAFATAVQLSIRLVERKQLRLAALMLEHALETASTSAEAVEVRGALLKVLQEEIERAERRRESKQYIASLGKRLEDLKKAPHPVIRKKEITARQEEPGREPSFVDAKSIVEAAVGTNDDQGWQMGQGEQAPTIAMGTAPSARLKISKVLLPLAVAGLIYGVWTFLLSEREVIDLGPRLVFSLGERALPLLSLPELDMRNSDTGYEAVMESVTKRLENRVTRKAESSSEGSSVAAEKDDTGNSSPQIVKSTPTPPASPNKLPEMNADALANSVVEVLASTGRQEEVKGSSVGRMPISVPFPGQKDLDGTPLQGYAIEQFDPPVMFRTIARTDVMSAPSVIATSLATLSAESKIQVVSKMGKWLEVKSSEGRRGYIHLQDAVQIKEAEREAAQR